MMRRVFFAVGVLLAAGARLSASDVNENELFSSPTLSTRAAVDAVAAEEKT